MIGVTTTSTMRTLNERFAHDAQTLFLYRLFANVARHEGHGGVASQFDRLAQAYGLLVEGHLDLVRDAEDPTNPFALGGTFENIENALLNAQTDVSQVTTEDVASAEREGYAAVASWLRNVAAVKREQIGRLENLLVTVRPRPDRAASP